MFPIPMHDALPRLTQGDHCCHIFDKPEDQLRLLVPYFALGLERGERGAFVGADGVLEPLRAGLKDAGVDVDGETRKGRLVLTSDRAFLQDGRFDSDRMLDFIQRVYDDTLAAGFTGLRAAGDVAWEVGPEKDFRDVIYYENLLDIFSLGKKMLVICQYSREGCPPDILRGILGTHKLAALDESVGPNIHYVPPSLLLEKNPHVRERKRVDWMTEQLRLTRKAEQAREKAVERLSREKGDLERAHAERRRLHERQLQSRKMDAVSRLADGVARDFDDRLAAILDACERLAQRPGDAPPELGQIRAAAEAAAADARRLRGIADGPAADPAPVDLNAVVEGARETLRRTLGEDVDFTVRLGQGVSPVAADPSALEQLVLNLAVNAREAMPHGGKLTLETAEVELDESYTGGRHDVGPGRYVMLSVADTGAGMDRAVRERLFEPFFTTKPGRGGGFGLATVYSIVKRYRGDIWVHSEPGHGTVFKIHFPRLEPAPAALSAGKRAANASPGPRAQATLLLVEDDDAVRTLARRTLQAEGYRVLEARNGLEAISLCERNVERIHLVLTEVALSKLSGSALVRRLNVLRPGLKAVFMSGHAESDDQRAGRSISFLSRPFTPESLSRKVREILDGV
jgi:signal transduction histidine kinase/CheY-like chemotaxis protein